MKDKVWLLKQLCCYPILSIPTLHQPIGLINENVPCALSLSVDNTAKKATVQKMLHAKTEIISI